MIPLILSTHFHNFVDTVYDAKTVIDSFSTAIVYQGIDTGLAFISKTTKASINNFPVNLHYKWLQEILKCDY